MAWYQNFFKRKAAPSYSVVRQIGGVPIFIGKSNKEFIDKGYTYNPNVYSVINVITKSIASVPFILYEVKDEKSFSRYKAAANKDCVNIKQAVMLRTKALQDVPKHKILDILQRPNPTQGQAEFIENVLGFKLLTGNAFIYGQGTDNGANANKMQQLYVLPSQYMSISPNASGTGVAGYQLELGTTTKFAKEEIIHLKYWNPNWSVTGDHLYGLSPLTSAHRVLQRSNDNITSQTKLLQNTGAIGILSNEDNYGMTEEQMEQMESKYLEKYGGSKNRGRIMIASQKFTWQQIGMSAVDLALNDAAKMDLRDICNVYGIQSQLLNDPENKTYANLAEARKSLIINRALPELYSLRDELNRTLVPQWSEGKNLYLDIDIQAIPELQEDMQLLVAQLSQMYWLTGNEKRIATNYEPDLVNPEMNGYFIPTGLMPLTGMGIEDSINDF